MTSESYSVAAFVEDLRRITGETADDKTIIRRVHPLVKRLASAPGWRTQELYQCDEAQGFGVHILHQEPDHSLTVLAASWLPGRGVVPHNHGTWAVIAGVDGPERNENWQRLDDGSRPGYAEIVKRHEVVVGEGDVISFLPDDIHSVHNDGAEVTLSLHVYGMHPNHTARSQFAPEAKTEQRFQFKES